MPASGGLWDLINKAQPQGAALGVPGAGDPQANAKLVDSPAPAPVPGYKSVITTVDGKQTVVKVALEPGEEAPGSQLAGQGGPTLHDISSQPSSTYKPPVDLKSPYHTMPARDLFKQSMEKFLSGGYQEAYDAMNYLATNRPQDFASLSNPGAILLKRLQGLVPY